MFVTICMCAIDPGFYRNVKHFRFILSLLFFGLINIKKYLFLHCPIHFQCEIPKDPKR